MSSGGSRREEAFFVKFSRRGERPRIVLPRKMEKRSPFRGGGGRSGLLLGYNGSGYYFDLPRVLGKSGMDVLGGEAAVSTRGVQKNKDQRGRMSNGLKKTYSGTGYR